MHKRTGALWCILAVVAVGLIVLLIPSWRNALVEFFQPPSDEPIYRGKPASYWAAAIKKGSPDALELLDRCPADAIPAMMELARYEDPTVRTYAACILTRVKPGDPAAMAVFVEALRREDAEVRLLALQGLGGMILAWQSGLAPDGRCEQRGDLVQVVERKLAGLIPGEVVFSLHQRSPVAPARTVHC